MTTGRTSTIGPYRLEGRLGAGGMGEVWRAWDERLDRSVAVKLIRPESAEDQIARERFRREARAAAALTHPAIVRIYDIIESGEGDAIVMELVEGELLARRIARGPLPIDEAVHLGRQIAEGLAAAHRRGIVHRDLKAENVIVTPDGEAKILDFGLAKRLEGEPEAPLTRSTAFVGTFRSVSPEQARGMKIDHRTDLFSFGVLLYEMLTGVSPFKCESATETLIQICTRQQTPVRELRPEVPEGLSSLIDHILRKDPAFRPSSVDDVIRALASAELTAPLHLDGEETLQENARSLVLPAGPTRPRRSWSGRALFLAGLALALLAAGLFWSFLRGRSSDSSLYVAVPRPEISGDRGGDGDLLVLGVREAMLRGLTALAGVAPLAPEQVDKVSGAPLDMALALAADEVLTAKLLCDRDNCRISLSRILGKDGSLLWTHSIEVPREEPYLLAEVIESQLESAYPDRRTRPGHQKLAVSPADYAEYMRLRYGFEVDKAGMPLETLLERVGALRRRSPRFIEAAIFEAAVRRYRFRQSRNPDDLQSALAVLDQAQEIAPEDPRPLLREVDVALAGENLDRAEAALRELERLQPGDPAVDIYRARLLERRGKTQEALTQMRIAVRRRPSWNHLLQLADMEYRLGEIAAARENLHQLLARSPGHYQGQTLLAQVELLNGDPRRAVELYSDLVRRSPQFTELGNLGTAYMLLRDYGRAEESLVKAAALEPKNPYAILSLADILLLQGKQEQARSEYRRLLELTERDPAGSHWQILSVRAQALAHLGREREAVEVVQKVMLTAQDNPQAAYESSLVYALVGDDSSSIVNAGRALAQGMEPRWFDFPWFDPLRANPEFRRLFRH